jgi:NAD+ synthase (glutamine-hydrolysing)
MTEPADFFNLYNHGFVRVAVGTPEVRVADPDFNGSRTITLMEKAEHEKAILALFPELGLTAYSCEDLFHQQALLNRALESLGTVLRASETLNLIVVVGMPLQVGQLLFNCAIVLQRGKILGVVPKTFLPNYREFYEYRQFAPAAAAHHTTVGLLGQVDIPFGERLLFQCQNEPGLTFFVEICEDLWVPIPPSCYAALAGATVILNLSASNIILGKDEYRHSLVANQSARCLAGYLYTAAGPGESTTDLAWDGHAMIYENGTLVAESERFHHDSQLVVAELDLDRLSQERMRQNSFGQSMLRYHEELRLFRKVTFDTEMPRTGR